MLGMVLSNAYAGRSQEVVRSAEKSGLMLLIAGPNVVRFLPALTVSDAQIEEASVLLRQALNTL